MNEEEKKAINNMKSLLLYSKEHEYFSPFMEQEIDDMDIVLNIVDNQQKAIEEKTTIIMAGAEKVKQLEKEIEELKRPKYLVHFENNKITKIELTNDYISKDKIRERIKELKEYKKEIEKEKDNEYFTVLRCIKELKQLLEEN